MSTEGYIVIGVILFLMVVLYKNWLGAGFSFLIGVSILGITGVLTPSEMLHGFANEQIAVIVLLLLIGEIIRKSSLIESLFNRLFMQSRSYRSFMLRLIFPISALSSIINNTPIVAIIMPYLHSWGKKNSISSSKLLIPLSYAAILGGMVTLIGTSTNLVVNGMVVDQTIIPEFTNLELFDFTPVGICLLVVGGLYLILFGDKMLPDRPNPLDKFSEDSREYIVEVTIKQGSAYHNKNIEESKLRSLKGLFLAEIIREGQAIYPVTPSTIIRDGDNLILAGNTETVIDMVENGDDLIPSSINLFGKTNKAIIKEVVISPNSRLNNKTVKESNFRGRYNSAIVAVHRNGERVQGKIGDMKLRTGDLLLVICGEDFDKIIKDSPDLYILNNIKSLEKIGNPKSLLILGGLIACISLSAFKIIPLFSSLIAFFIILLLTKSASPKEVYRNLNFNIVMVIAMAMALGTAMVKTGLAYSVSHVVVSFLQPFGILAMLFGIYLITNLLAAIISNIGAVAIVFPIVISLASELGLDPKPFALLIAFAGAASFITPIGYQTNLMVYGPGGYNFKDFFRIGFPLAIIAMFIVVIILKFQFNLSL